MTDPTISPGLAVQPSAAAVVPSLASTVIVAGHSELVPFEPASLKAGMLKILSEAKDGASYVAQAQELASQVNLDTLGMLLAHGQSSRDALSSVSNSIIGESRVEEAGSIGQLFTSLGEINQALQVQKLSKPMNPVQEILTKLPFGIGKQFEPVIRFLERYRKIKPQIDAKESTLSTMEVERTKSQEQLKALQSTILSGFRTLEVSIAAGEIVLQRETKSFEEARTQHEQSGSQDLVEVQRLRQRRLALVNLDNRILRLQVARGDAMIDLPIIQNAIDNEESLRSTLEDLRTVTIPQIRKAVAIAIRIHDQRVAASMAGDVNELNANLRSANIEALGVAQEETHQVATQAARDVNDLVGCMEELGKVLERGNELLKLNKKLNEEARTVLGTASTKLIEGLQQTLSDTAL